MDRGRIAMTTPNALADRQPDKLSSSAVSGFGSVLGSQVKVGSGVVLGLRPYHTYSYGYTLIPPGRASQQRTNAIREQHPS